MSSKLSNIKGTDLRDRILKTKDSCALALDGWRVPELKDLPLPFYNLVADAFNLVESGQPWPEICSSAIISTIPKEICTDAADISAGQILSGDGLSNRPITNMSPLYGAYSSVRFSEMSGWREQWMDPTMHGARQCHEVFDTSWT